MSNRGLAALCGEDARGQKASDLLSPQMCPETLSNLSSSLFLTFFSDPPPSPNHIQRAARSCNCVVASPLASPEHLPPLPVNGGSRLACVPHTLSGNAPSPLPPSPSCPERGVWCLWITEAKSSQDGGSDSAQGLGKAQGQVSHSQDNSHCALYSTQCLSSQHLKAPFKLQQSWELGHDLNQHRRLGLLTQAIGLMSKDACGCRPSTSSTPSFSLWPLLPSWPQTPPPSPFVFERDSGRSQAYLLNNLSI